MGILYYFIGCIPMGIVSLILNHIIEKIHLLEKFQKFDEVNSGPIYDFFKTLFFIFLFIFGVLSLSILILPLYIYLAFVDGNILEGLILTLISSVMFTFYCNVFDR